MILYYDIYDDILISDSEPPDPNDSYHLCIVYYVTLSLLCIYDCDGMCC